MLRPHLSRGRTRLGAVEACGKPPRQTVPWVREVRKRHIRHPQPRDSDGFATL